MASLTEIDSSSSESSSDAEGSSSQAVGPPRAKIARKLRAVVCNPGKKGVSERCHSRNDLSKKSLWERVRDFKGEHLSVKAGRLFCEVCCEPLSSKKSSVANHVKSTKHTNSKKAFAKSRAKSQTLQQVLKRHDDAIHAKGESLPIDMRAWRMEVLEGFLSAGIPLKKVDYVRHLLERNNFRLTSSCNLAQLIPVVLQHEVERLKDDLKSEGGHCKDVAVIFDGSTRQGEAIAIIARYVNNWQIQQSLLKLDIVAKSVNATDLAQVLHACMIDFTVHGPRVLAFMRDGASVNGAAFEHLRIFYPNAVSITCMSHTIDNVAQHFDIPCLDVFSQWWISLFSHSCRAKLRWKELTGKSMKSYSETRWWSRWEILDQVCKYFGDLELFLDENQDLAPKTMDRIRLLFADPEQKRNLQLELAAVVDVGVHFVKATYTLEGDGPLVFSAFRKLQEVAAACAVQHFPNISAVARKLVEEDQELDIEDLEEWAKARVRPGVMWFLQQFNVKHRAIVDAFKYARYCCPVQVQTLQPDAVAIENLRIFPFLNEDNTIQHLQQELPAYLAAANGCHDLTDEEKLDWWQHNEQNLPFWSEAVKKVLLVQPSSAAAERVFSLLRAAFSQQQEAALADYLQASIMLQYNHRK